MTHDQRNAAIIEAMHEYARKHLRTPEDARAALIAGGMYKEDGALRPEFGGPGWERKSG